MSIIVKNLTKKYGEQKAVNNISFEVNTGEIVGFLGPNGAGKSTTMKIITCYLGATSGDVKLDNYSIKTDAQEIKKRIGYLPENNPLYGDMAIIDYLWFCAEIQGVQKSLIPQRISEMIDVCGLERERHKKIGELSKGYRQRVGLAQAMIHNPEVLVLDEPTTGLDPNQIIEIRNLIKDLGKEKTVILSSHILSEVEATCDRILIINKGRIVADGTAESLRGKAQAKEILTVEIEGSEVEETLRSLPTIESVSRVPNKQNTYIIQSKSVENSSRKAIFDACISKNWNLLGMTAQETKLEDVFREVTNEK
ncbi:MAG: gliding motility-associated ABC transporter ATP-binding subunit GldA [Chitinophagaceae bacterium]|nr:gliding motility-associated ABC transporter ATP-binding subunit GldA [Chitinophagaceae bacterium]